MLFLLTFNRDSKTPPFVRVVRIVHVEGGREGVPVRKFQTSGCVDVLLPIEGSRGPKGGLALRLEFFPNDGQHPVGEPSHLAPFFRRLQHLSIFPLLRGGSGCRVGWYDFNVLNYCVVMIQRLWKVSFEGDLEYKGKGKYLNITSKLINKPIRLIKVATNSNLRDSDSPRLKSF